MKKRFRLFQRNTKKLFPNSDAVIEFAFKSGCVDYFTYADIFSLPYERGLMALAVYSELDMRCSREYLTKHTKVVTDMLRQKEIDIYKLSELNEQMKQRLELVADVELMYKLASVVYFDKNENPARYEQVYCEKKIEKWRKDSSVSDFFLQKPLLKLIPFLQSVDFDLDTYSELNQRINELHLERLQLLKSKR